MESILIVTKQEDRFYAYFLGNLKQKPVLWKFYGLFTWQSTKLSTGFVDNF